MATAIGAASRPRLGRPKPTQRLPRTVGGRRRRADEKKTWLRQTELMAENTLSVPAYNPSTGVVAPVEGGTVTVEIRDGAVEIFGDSAGLRDLARWCLALSDTSAPPGAHVHLDPGIIPLDLDSVSLMLSRRLT